jgi:hypothetical protein
MAQALTIVLTFTALAVLRFGVPILGIWLINKGCCLLQQVKIS